MKKIIAGAILLFSLSLSSQAQKTSTDKGNKTKGEMRHNKMGKTKHDQFKGVDLTDAQKKQMQANKEAFRKQQKDVLTPAQQQQMEKNKQEKMAAKQQMMKKKLSLTDAQSNQLKALHEKNKAQAKAIKENNSYSQEVKKEMLKELRENNKKSHMSILTAEQQQNMKEMKHGNKDHEGHGRKSKMESRK